MYMVYIKPVKENYIRIIEYYNVIYVLHIESISTIHHYIVLGEGYSANSS